jgi:hypothetical protein
VKARVKKLVPWLAFLVYAALLSFALKVVGAVFDILVFAGPLLAITWYGLAVTWCKLPRPRRIWQWLAIGSATTLAIAWPFSVGVWLPDIFTFGSPHTLTRVSGRSGAIYEVIQYWNYVDFYTTELRITSADGMKKVIELDCDDQKSWTVPLDVDELAWVATVTLSGQRTMTIDLREGTVSKHTKA